ncbi:cupin domain-containing protein [Nodosilinea sp. LEGE 07298]|uniref:cupin domain-containing protein n=1 Tax=Nodosilinea sp. LEGE 07298 TaxID=2777970 RepID=UPI001882FF53|nr:cupin domain-containing protein [Nodosilinea sp. LEGE 07298]MBE9112182.1 cupin domain-containing protein [Nodosilinea sp. LEGE 07298]
MGQIQSTALTALGLVVFSSIDLSAKNVMAIETPDAAIALETSNSGLSNSTVVDLNDLTANPGNYDFFTFRPNLEKLILSGAADTEHVSILWYTIPDGSVGLHYHSMTESVYVIDGTQTDDKGVYPTGSLYFNPPGSGHEVSNSTGFFILAYASPPDFANTDLIEAYTPVQIDTAAPNFETVYPFEDVQDGVSIYPAPLDPAGGMSSQFIKSTSLESYEYTGNYLLVLEGSCTIDGTSFDSDMLVVATTVETQSYQVSAVAEGRCLALGLSF